jgi:hypothetical protein
LQDKTDVTRPDEQHTDDDSRAPQRRRSYEKPSIVWEEQLDVRRTLAVACAKIRGQAGICNAAPTS